MKIVIAALLAGFCMLTAAYPYESHKYTDKEFIEKQRLILRLFKHVNQPSYYKDHVEIAKIFHPHEPYENYTKPEVARHLRQIYDYGALSQGAIFSIFNEDHLEEAIGLFRILYYAKDFDTFYKTAIAARQRINEGIYLYALSVAIYHRPDTYGIVIPPIYEVYPHYFFSSEVIQEAYKYKQQYYGSLNEQDADHYYTITSNYSGYYLNLHPEQSLSYYTEDVGINSYYYYFNLYYPYWLSSKEFDFTHDRRGENFLLIIQNMLAKYYLERLSNGFGEIPSFNWEIPFETGYYPSLQYPNGLQFPVRPNYANLYEYFYNYGQKYGNNKYAYSYTHVQDYERRIRDAIDKGYVYTHEAKKVDLYTLRGVNVFGNLLEGNVDSPDPHFYGPLHVYARHLLGYSYQPLDKQHAVPSALEHYETSFRDPAFYQFYKRLGLYYQKYKSRFPAYTEQELTFPGVEVKNVKFDRLVTYFDYFYSDISNALYVTPQEFQTDKIKVRVRQQRLNHKPFTYKIFVESDNDQEAFVRVFIGPKYDEYGRYINLTENNMNFVTLDVFKYHLKTGQNVIVRNSYETPYYHPDRTSYKRLYQQVLTGQFEVHKHDIWYGLPQRFLLPKGSSDGFEFQFFVFVTPYVPYQGYHKLNESTEYFYPKVGSGNKYFDYYPLGYPLDRPVHYDQVFYNVPNAYFYSTKVYHEHVDDINASTKAHYDL